MQTQTRLLQQLDTARQTFELDAHRDAAPNPPRAAAWPWAPFFRRFNAPLEKIFTVVYWDQRGSGKSFDRKLSRSSMTVEQFIADLDELTQAVCERVGGKQVVIFGHSWGSAFGVLYAARFAENVAAYVGSGQVGDTAAGESGSYAFALAEAERLNNRKALDELRAIGPPSYPVSGLFRERFWVNRLQGQTTVRASWDLGRLFLRGPELSILDLPNLARGFRFTLDAMLTETTGVNHKAGARVADACVLLPRTP
jgi:pimeloyl-ACP methyl ester carboxylesterase